MYVPFFLDVFFFLACVAGIISGQIIATSNDLTSKGRE